MNLKTLLETQKISQRRLADAVKVSPATINNITKGDWPPSLDQPELTKRITQFLLSKGVPQTTLDAVFNVPTPKTETPEPKEDQTMILRKQTLTSQAKRHFNLFTNPFAQDVQNPDELFLSPDINYVRTAMHYAAKCGGFIAVCGDSGAGKSTLRRDLHDRIQRGKSPIITIEPYVLAAEDNDTKGKTLKSLHIAETIVAALAPLESPKRSPEARFRQIHHLLKESSRAGNSHVLIIEEAHSLPIPTLKHLKRFFELEDGYKKLLSIILIGQNELALKLSEQNQEVREVVQRCEIVTLEPLTQTGLVDYLKHRCKIIDRKLADFIDEGGITAIATKLTTTPARQGLPARSLLYPLAIGNLMTGALNQAAELGVPYITADLVREV